VPVTPVEKLPVVSVEVATRDLNRARENVEKAQVVATAAAAECDGIRAAAREGRAGKPSSLTDAIAASEFASLRVSELRQQHELAQGTFRLAEADERATRASEALPVYKATVKDAAAMVSEALATYTKAVDLHDRYIQENVTLLSPGITDRVVLDHVGLRLDGRRVSSIRDAAASSLASLLEPTFRHLGQPAAAQQMANVVAGGPASLAHR
jgi:hypothetical protein